MQNILDVKHLNYTFSGLEKPLLRNITFELNANEHLYIIGESGSGKSTLMKLIAGLEDWNEGEIAFYNRSLKGACNQTIPGHKDIVLADQRFKADPNLTVVENMKERLFGLGLTSLQSTKRIEKVLRIFQLHQKGNQKIKSLSGGEAQRASLAKTFVRPAKLYLLDEPFSHLDYITRTLVLRKLHQLTGKAAIIEVAHQPEDFLKVGSRLMVLHKGAIEAIGEATQLYLNPPTKHIARLTGDYNVLHASDYANIDRAEAYMKQGNLGIRPENLIAFQDELGSFVVADQFLKAGERYAICFGQSKVSYKAKVENGPIENGSKCNLKCMGDEK